MKTKTILSLTFLMNVQAEDRPKNTGNTANPPMNCDSTCIGPQINTVGKVNIAKTEKNVGQFNWGPQCGASAGSVLPNAPDSFLCSTGTPSAVSTVNNDGETLYKWTCTAANGSQTACGAERRQLGSCGASNGQYLSSNPSNLCSAGNAVGFALLGSTYQWFCQGNYGTRTSCSATYYNPPPPDPPVYAPGCAYRLSGVPIALASGYSTPHAPCTIICYGTGPSAVCDIF